MMNFCYNFEKCGETLCSGVFQLFFPCKISYLKWWSEWVEWYIISKKFKPGFEQLNKHSQKFSQGWEKPFSNLWLMVFFFASRLLFASQVIRQEILLDWVEWYDLLTPLSAQIWTTFQNFQKMSIKLDENFKFRSRRAS